MSCAFFHCFVYTVAFYDELNVNLFAAFTDFVLTLCYYFCLKLISLKYIYVLSWGVRRFFKFRNVS